MEGHVLLCVMPRRSTAWASAAAMWVTASGWAAAGGRRFGEGWVMTPDRLASPAEARAFTIGSTRGDGRDHSHLARVARRVPTPVVTAGKDLRSWARARRYRDHPPAAPWVPGDVAFVWQHHDLFHRTGVRLARRLECPLVSFVHAPQVWEAEAWGVRRPGWGRLLERVGEVPQLLASDLVACVSDEVASELERLGVDRHRVVVAPMAVDPDVFRPDVDGTEIRRRHRLDGTVVIGWTGSFRRFHGLDQAIEAFAEVHRRLPTARLLLVGDGKERAQVSDRVHSLGLADAVVFTGPIGHTDVPAHVAAMDLTLVTARPAEGFHYSPLKLREYLAAGRPVVAPRVGEMGRLLDRTGAGLLYEPGDPHALATRLVELASDPTSRARLGATGRRWALAHATWDVQLAKVVDALGHLPRGATSQ